MTQSWGLELCDTRDDNFLPFRVKICFSNNIFFFIFPTRIFRQIFGLNIWRVFFGEIPFVVDDETKVERIPVLINLDNHWLDMKFN